MQQNNKDSSHRRSGSNSQPNGKEGGRTSRTQKYTSFPVVALCGSAGSLGAFEKFFMNMPANSGMCFVIVIHLDPNHKGQFSDLIRNFTPMPVREAEDGITIQPDTVFVIPPNSDLGIHNSKLLLLSPSSPSGYRLPIDYFLQSLAEDQWHKAVAIIFSGMGSDGETGLRMIKVKLGLAMVQEPETALYDSMPKAAIDTNLVDYVLAPEEMPLTLIRFLNHPLLREEFGEAGISESKNTNAIHKILMLLRSHNGHDFTLYKKNTITRRIDRRVAFHQLADYGEYVDFLRENPHEIDILFQELLIGVTKFFRDSQAFELLTEKLFSQLDQKQWNAPIRVWVAGCSTGEEAYSLAIILMEYIHNLKDGKAPKIQIFATDLDLDAIEHARAGVYHSNIIADVSETRLQRFFVKKDETYVVKKELREMIVFAQHNIIKDAPFTRLDLLSCRNVMIYLTAELQKKIIPIFHYSLNPGGLLFLGPAETVGGFTDAFSAVEGKWKLFARKEGTISLTKMMDFPFHVSRPPLLKNELVEALPKKKILADSFSKILLEDYTPTSVLINEKGDIAYINGRSGRFLELNSGEAVMNIYRLAKEELKYVLSNAVHQAKNAGTEICIEDIRLKEEDRQRVVNLRVRLLQDTPLQGLLLIVFEDKGIFKKPKSRSVRMKSVEMVRFEELEKELIYTKQQLHSTIEQMETSVEELKSTNEELQSTNEELQSTNEEALTTKEEMQSLNEELMTINLQYQAKAEELTQLNNDMKNMLDNMEVGTIFLDNNLEILRFTPQVKKIFKVIESDLGRSITQIAADLSGVDLQEEIKSVIETLKAKELEVRTKDGEWFNLRIIPYRTLDNFISGAVLTINKITAVKAMEDELLTLQAFAKKKMETSKHAMLLLGMDLGIILVNSVFEETFKITAADLKHRSFVKTAHLLWNTSAFDHLPEKIGQAPLHFNWEDDTSGIGTRQFKISANTISTEQTRDSAVVLTMQQIN